MWFVVGPLTELESVRRAHELAGVVCGPWPRRPVPVWWLGGSDVAVIGSAVTWLSAGTWLVGRSQK